MSILCIDAICDFKQSFRKIIAHIMRRSPVLFEQNFGDSRFLNMPPSIHGVQCNLNVLSLQFFSDPRMCTAGERKCICVNFLGRVSRNT